MNYKKKYLVEVVKKIMMLSTNFKMFWGLIHKVLVGKIFESFSLSGIAILSEEWPSKGFKHGLNT